MRRVSVLRSRKNGSIAKPFDCSFTAAIHLWSHNPKVGGSNPPPIDRYRPFTGTGRKPFYVYFCLPRLSGRISHIIPIRRNSRHRIVSRRLHWCPRLNTPRPWRLFQGGGESCNDLCFFLGSCYLKFIYFATFEFPARAGNWFTNREYHLIPCWIAPKPSSN